MPLYRESQWEANELLEKLRRKSQKRNFSQKRLIYVFIRLSSKTSFPEICPAKILQNELRSTPIKSYWRDCWEKTSEAIVITKIGGSTVKSSKVLLLPLL